MKFQWWMTTLRGNRFTNTYVWIIGVAEWAKIWCVGSVSAQVKNEDD